MNLLQYARVQQNSEKASLLFTESKNSGRMEYKEKGKVHTVWPQTGINQFSGRVMDDAFCFSTSHQCSK